MSSFLGFFREFFRRSFGVLFHRASSAPFLARVFTAFFVEAFAAHFFACAFPVALSRWLFPCLLLKGFFLVH